MQSVAHRRSWKIWSSFGLLIGSTTVILSAPPEPPRQPSSRRTAAPEAPAEPTSRQAETKPSTNPAAKAVTNVLKQKPAKPPGWTESTPSRRDGQVVQVDARSLERSTSSLKGITPGESTARELDELWGAARLIEDDKCLERRLYAIEPFKQVEVLLKRNKVVAVEMVLIEPVPAPALVRELNLDGIETIVVADEDGELMGELFPERGVLMTFNQPGPAAKVSRIVLEPLDAESFVLRAQSNFTKDSDKSLADLAIALELNPRLTHAGWLRARLLASAGRLDEALEAINRVVNQQPQDPVFRLSRASILEQHGEHVRAVADARESVTLSAKNPAVQARAYCYLGDLVANGPGRDYAQAIDHHQNAIKLAVPLRTSETAGIRQMAQEVLVDAYLGVAVDISWGRWKNKARVVPKWLTRAEEMVTLIEGDAWTRTEFKLRLASKALFCYAGMQQAFEDNRWPESALESGEELIQLTDDPVRQQYYHWQLGTALHDAMKTYLTMGKFDEAMTYGSKCLEHFEQASFEQLEKSDSRYQVARCKFRMGSIEAIHKQDHRKAVDWYKQALPTLEEPVPVSGLADKGRQGETLVSMAISFWQIGSRDEALRLTLKGKILMEDAVKEGLLEQTALAVPYNNLAGMHAELGNDDKAAEYDRLATKVQPTTSVRQ